MKLKQNEKQNMTHGTNVSYSIIVFEAMKQHGQEYIG